MTLRLRHLRLRVETGRGRFGADIPFEDGLTILRADNTRGKSTSVKSILFALGLERMITARPANALTAAMRDRLIYDPSSKQETAVLASSVSLQMQGRDGHTATVTRWLRHEHFDPALVRVVHGPMLTATGEYRTEDFYVGRAGAAAHERGFHRWLADFMGWEMPTLTTTDGRTVPLYLEQVFPLLFVEQRRGWGGIQAQMPAFAGVSDVRRRAIEFLLDLDVGKREAERQRLKLREAELQDAWRTAVRAFKESLVGQGLVPVRVPEGLTVAWPPQPLPTLAESRNGSWVSLDALLRELQLEQSTLEKEEIPRVEAVAADAEKRLNVALKDLDALRLAETLMRDDILRDRTELQSVRDRLVALTEDLREHQDILTLQRVGSTDLDRLHGDCPVCHQPLPSSLLAADLSARTLSPEDTVAYIRQQVELFEVMARDGERALQAKGERWAALRSRSGELRSEVRALRTTLTAPNGSPSAEFIAKRIHLQARIERLQALSEQLFQLFGELERLADQAREVRAALSELPAAKLSAVDQVKLNLLQRSFIEQLHEYDFGSFSDERLSVSEDDYLPRRDEFDLQADISASDSIRVVWAYLLGLLEASAQRPTNHPGLLVFDEPRQQSTKDLSFAALLRRASQAAHGKQVIFATSEPLDSLGRMLNDVPHTMHVIDGYLLRPVNDYRRAG